MEFDAEGVPTVGAETFGAAEAGEAVDAAVGLRRYGTQRAVRAAQKPLYTYIVGLPVAGPPLVAIGVVNYRVNTSFQVIDFIAIGTAAVWLLSSFYIGDTNMFLGAGSVAADMFFPAVMNRGLRYTTAKGGRDINIGWIYNAGTSTIPTLVMSLKVRSYFRG